MTATGTVQPPERPGQDDSASIFSAEMLAEIAEAIARIRRAGGRGELIIVIVKGRVRFINHTIGKEYKVADQP